MDLKKILIADDDQVILAFIKKSLEKEGFVVATGSNGADLITAANEMKPDLIITDVKMPVMNGVDAVEQLFTKWRAENIKLPQVIFMTAYTDLHLQEKAKLLNPIDFLYKPFDIPSMIRKIKRVFNIE